MSADKTRDSELKTREKGILGKRESNTPSMSFLLVTEVADECGESAGMQIEIRGKKGFRGTGIMTYQACPFCS